MHHVLPFPWKPNYETQFVKHLSHALNRSGYLHVAHTVDSMRFFYARKIASGYVIQFLHGVRQQGFSHFAQLDPAQVGCQKQLSSSVASGPSYLNGSSFTRITPICQSFGGFRPAVFDLPIPVSFTGYLVDARSISPPFLPRFEPMQRVQGQQPSFSEDFTSLVKY